MSNCPENIGDHFVNNSSLEPYKNVAVTVKKYRMKNN